MSQEILRLENLSGDDPEAIVIRQGDTSPLKFRLIGSLEEEYQSLKFKVYISKDGEKYYQAEGTVSNKEIVEFSITEILPVGSFDLEIVIGDKRKFPSAYYSMIIYISPSAEYSDEKIIERYGKEALIQDILPRVVKGSVGPPGLPGKDGVDGKDGTDGVDGKSITITDTSTDEQGNTIITFSDETSVTVKRGKDGRQGIDGERGEDGKDGIDGQSPTAKVLNNGDGTHTVIITNPDGNTTETTIKDGAKGEDGQDGQDGKTPTVETNTNEDGSTTIIIKDGDGQLIDEITIKDGEKGQDGVDGKDGINGIDGKDGTDGQDGKSITITETTNDSDGNTLIHFSDNTTVKVQRGRDGEQGTSVTIESQERNPKGETVLKFSDGTSVTLPKGDPFTYADFTEEQLENLKGKSIQVLSTDTTGSGDLLVNFTDGTSITIPKGEKGDKGQDGIDGTDGKSVTVWHGTGDEFESVEKQDGTLYLIKE